jgi:hypothetical protein
MAIESESLEGEPRTVPQADPQAEDGSLVDAVALSSVSVATNALLLRRLDPNKAGGEP